MWGQKNLCFDTSALHMGPSCQFRCQFGIIAKSVHIANSQQIYRDFLQLKHKIIVFLKFYLKNRGFMLTTPYIA
jgi:hypothetical protein